MGCENTFQPGDRIEIICENTEVVLPDDSDADNLDPHGFTIGREFTLSTNIDDHYDDYDNSWLLGGRGGMWVHEGAMRLAVAPVTQDEEDETLASIMKAMGS